MTPRRPTQQRHPSGVALLLAQVGALGARLFAEQIAPLGLTATQAQVLRLIAGIGSPNQAELAGALGVRPSRLVVVLDELESGGLVRRDPHPDDRRQRLIVLTDAGHEVMLGLVAAATDHEDHLCAALSVEERGQLRGLLAKIAADHGGTPGLHPGHPDTPATTPAAAAADERMC